MAIDTETMGLDPHRDRLCVVQLSPGDGSADVVQIAARADDGAESRARCSPTRRSLKIFHFARFDIGMLYKALRRDAASRSTAPRSPRGWPAPTPTSTGSRTSRANVLGIDLSKQQQSSDWGAETLTDAQVAYAASDVLHLHALKEKLDAMLAREGRAELAAACFRFLPDRARLDLAGWAAEDIFAHSS